MKKVQRNKRFKKKRAVFFGAQLFLFVCLFFVVGIICYFVFDDFNLYFIAAYRQQQEAERSTNSSEEFVGYGLPNSFDEWSGSTNVSGWQKGSGVPALHGMYINAMQGGYYSEFLDIAHGTATWKYMHPDASQLKQNGKVIYPSVGTLLGFAISESGIDTDSGGVTGGGSGAGVSPYSHIAKRYYANDGQHTLKTYNSAVIASEDGSTLTAGYRGRLSLDYMNGSTNTPTVMQITRRYFAIFPSGRVNTEAPFYPSTLNGYGINRSTLRTKADTDAGYLPDLYSVAVQLAWSGQSSFSSAIDNMSYTAAQTAFYPVYNYGNHALTNAWGMGTTDRSVYMGSNGKSWSSKNSVGVLDCLTMTINKVDKVVVELLQELFTHYEEYTDGLWTGSGSYSSGWHNHEDWTGIAQMSMLMRGAFVSPETKSSVISGFSNESRGRGALLAYRCLTRNKDATKDDMLKAAQSIPVKDLSAYKSHGTGPIYLTHDEYKIYLADGSGPLPSLASFNEVGLRGAFLVRGAGVLCYWKMLNAAGVECSLVDAYNDSIEGVMVVEAQKTAAAGSQRNGSAVVSGDASYYNGGIAFNSFLNTNTLASLSSAIYYRNLNISEGIHYGEDYDIPLKTKLYAIASGTVVAVTNRVKNPPTTGWGNYVKIAVDSKPGEPKMEFLYGHMTEVTVKNGDHVSAGDFVGYSGNTGIGTGSHLHLDYYVYRPSKNAQDYYCLPFRAMYEHRCCPANAPGVIHAAKKTAGNTYGADTSIVLGELRDTRSDDNALKSNLGWGAAYTKVGVMRYLEAAVKQSGG